MSKVAAKRAAKIQTIYNEAARLFAANGFSGTRMEDIAAGVGMRKASLYYYFDSKEALLTSLVQERVGAALEALRSIVDQPVPAEERVREAIRSHLTVFQTQSDVYTIYNSERFQSISRELAEKVDSLGREYEALWAGLLSSGVDSGHFRPMDVPVVVKAILGACNATLAWYHHGGRLEIEAVAEEFGDLFLSGLSD